MGRSGTCLLTIWFSWGLALPLAAGEPAPVSAEKKTIRQLQSLLEGDEPRMSPGAWVAYDVTIKPTGAVQHPPIRCMLKISTPLHADIEHPLGEGESWVELEMYDPNDAEQSFLVMKVLTKGDPRQEGAIRRAYVKFGNAAAFELGSGALKRPDGEPPPVAGSCQQPDRSQNLRKRLYTKAGWLNAERVVRQDEERGLRSEVWTSKEVPLFGLVRLDRSDGAHYELEGFGSGALSRIDETKAVPMPDLKEVERQLEMVAPGH